MNLNYTTECEVTTNTWMVEWSKHIYISYVLVFVDVIVWLIYFHIIGIGKDGFSLRDSVGVEKQNLSSVVSSSDCTDCSLCVGWMTEQTAEIITV